MYIYMSCLLRTPKEQCSIQQCSLTQYTGSISLQEFRNCEFNTSTSSIDTLPSVYVQSDLNQESLALQLLNELNLLNASKKCVDGFMPWICSQLNISCASNSSSEECVAFESYCAEDAYFVMTSSYLKDVCYLSSNETSSGNGKSKYTGQNVS